MVDEYIKNIKVQMLNMFFIEKQVRFDQELFLEFYHQIFPAPKDFQIFLKTSGKDTMQGTAVQISKRIFSDSLWNGMQYLFRNLLSFETNMQPETQNTYIHQDHAVHSVHLYLLGIYIYFNFSVFHSALKNYYLEMNLKSEFSYTEEELALWGFLESWKIFAFSHDFAYPYEALFSKSGGQPSKNQKGILKNFEQIRDHMYYAETMDYLSGLIFANILMDECNYSLERIVQDACEFKDEKSGKILKDPQYLMENAKNYYKLKWITTNEDFRRLQIYFPDSDFVLVAKNQYYQVIGISIQSAKESGLFIKEKCYLSLLHDISHTGYLEIRRKKIHLEFYISDNAKRAMTESMDRVHLSSRKNALKKLSGKIKSLYSIRFASCDEYGSISDILYDISSFLMTKCPKEYCIPASSFLKTVSENLIPNRKELLRTTIQKSFNMILDGKLNTHEEILTYNETENILGEIKKINLVKLCEEADEEYHRMKFERDENKLDCIEIFKKIFNKFLEDEETPDCPLTQCHQYLINNLSKDFQEKILKLMEQENFLKHGESLEKFLKYQPCHSSYDHGILAGIIVAAYYNKKIQMVSSLGEKRILTNSQAVTPNGMERIAAEISYAILIHNIYLEPYKSTSGNLPEHTLISNPLSYFGMFCDNIQVWDRNKAVDYGIVKWNGRTLYGENISINFGEQKIYMTCVTNDIIVSFSKLKEGMAEYLIGANELISLGLIENKNIYSDMY